MAKIKLGLANELKLGNLEARRDWGHAREYVEAMWLMMQQDQPDDFVVAAGIHHSVRDFAEKAFAHVGLDYHDYVKIDRELLRPADVENLLGDPTAARTRLGWKSLVGFDDLVKEMVNADLHLLTSPGRH